MFTDELSDALCELTTAQRKAIVVRLHNVVNRTLLDTGRAKTAIDVERTMGDARAIVDAAFARHPSIEPYHASVADLSLGFPT
jgi:hypothetical protein